MIKENQLSNPNNSFNSINPNGQAASEYFIDAMQRSVLFCDVLRKRGNVYQEHRKKGKPPVLSFDYEMIVDGRDLECPVNYALLRITPDEGVVTDESLRPYVVVDPRAGHGPGIGGSKKDSQVGMALQAGHPVYFVTFFPEPEPDQTLKDVADAETMFIEQVIKNHPKSKSKPCVIGNCQAGWAVATLAALNPETVGPIILNGSPLSYWSGVGNDNPMRYNGGLMGGKWVQSLTCDLGNGRFDGAHLVSNFEKLNPANTLWSKNYNLYANIDTEEERFLEFEKWWGGFFMMNEEEIEAIVADLFIGNKLAKGGFLESYGLNVDLKNIRSPIVVFCSWGDNITPPPQALNWILDYYATEEEIIKHQQTIVYMVHENVGHLGIFVSGGVARKHHAEMIETMDMIDTLPPGLYEMVIDEKTHRAESSEKDKGEFTVRMEKRMLTDIEALDDGREDEDIFPTMNAVSEFNDQAYKTFLSPLIKMMINDGSAEKIRETQPLRLQRTAFSDENPAMKNIETMAEKIRQERQVVSKDNPFLMMEKDFSNSMEVFLNSYRDTRDNYYGTLVKHMYGPLGLQAFFPSNGREAPKQGEENLDEDDKAYLKEMSERMDQGGFPEAVIRMIMASMDDEKMIERRFHQLTHEMMDEHKELKDLSHSDRKKLITDQSIMLHLDKNRAIQTLPDLLSKKTEQRQAVALVKEMLTALTGNDGADKPVVKKISTVLNVDW